MPVETINLLRSLEHAPEQERFEPLIQTGDLLLERIVSFGHVTPEGQWYDQERDEWVMLLTGSAHLRFEGESAPVRMQPGDAVHIPAHRRHRVEWTQPGMQTIWLALHFRAGGD